ncbi:MAG: hypothetical protein AAB116_01995, partial [Candidatus Poribacteria bacterium]
PLAKGGSRGFWSFSFYKVLPKFIGKMNHPLLFNQIRYLNKTPSHKGTKTQKELKVKGSRLKIRTWIFPNL